MERNEKLVYLLAAVSFIFLAFEATSFIAEIVVLIAAIFALQVKQKHKRNKLAGIVVLVFFFHAIFIAAVYHISFGIL